MVGDKKERKKEVGLHNLTRDKTTTVTVKPQLVSSYNGHEIEYPLVTLSMDFWS